MNKFNFNSPPSPSGERQDTPTGSNKKLFQADDSKPLYQPPGFLTQQNLSSFTAFLDSSKTSSSPQQKLSSSVNTYFDFNKLQPASSRFSEVGNNKPTSNESQYNNIFKLEPRNLSPTFFNNISFRSHHSTPKGDIPPNRNSFPASMNNQKDSTEDEFSSKFLTSRSKCKATAEPFYPQISNDTNSGTLSARAFTEEPEFVPDMATFHQFQNIKSFSTTQSKNFYKAVNPVIPKTRQFPVDFFPRNTQKINRAPIMETQDSEDSDDEKLFSPFSNTTPIRERSYQSFVGHESPQKRGSTDSTIQGQLTIGRGISHYSSDFDGETFSTKISSNSLNSSGKFDHSFLSNKIGYELAPEQIFMGMGRSMSINVIPQAQNYLANSPGKPTSKPNFFTPQKYYQNQSMDLNSLHHNPNVFENEIVAQQNQNKAPKKKIKVNKNTNQGQKKKPPADEDASNYEIDLNNLGHKTTLMIKNIPNKYDQDMLLEAVDKNFKGKYDFLYLPIDLKNQCNVGYAFINFIDTKPIPDFYREFHGKKWEKFKSEKICDIKYARLQGFDSLLQHFQNSNVMNKPDKKLKPFISRPYELLAHKEKLQELVNRQKLEGQKQ